jgi:small subunit ribosomal protein S20
MPAKKKTMRHRSAIKAHRQSLRRHARNVAMKKTIRRAARAAGDAATAKDSKTAELLAKASSAFDRAAQRGTIHWKTAARRKSRLAKRVASGLAAAAAPAKA